MSSSVSLVIPAYNEAARICETVGEAYDYFRTRGQAFEIIVSADGTDGTREAAAEFGRTREGIRVIGSPVRRGKGCGLREGVRIAQGDIIGFTDADNKTPIAEFDKVEPRLREGHDVVIGSRAILGAQIEQRQPMYRRLGSSAFGLFMHMCVGLGDIPDTQCGFKFFRGDVARDLFALQQIDGYMFDVEVLYLARARGLPDGAGADSVARRRRQPFAGLVRQYQDGTRSVVHPVASSPARAADRARTAPAGVTRIDA